MFEACAPLGSAGSSPATHRSGSTLTRIKEVLGLVGALLLALALSAQTYAFLVADGYYSYFDIDPLEAGVTPLNASYRLINTWGQFLLDSLPYIFVLGFVIPVLAMLGGGPNRKRLLEREIHDVGRLLVRPVGQRASDVRRELEESRAAMVRELENSTARSILDAFRFNREGFGWHLAVSVVVFWILLTVPFALVDAGSTGVDVARAEIGPGPGADDTMYAVFDDLAGSDFDLEWANRDDHVPSVMTEAAAGRTERVTLIATVGDQDVLFDRASGRVVRVKVDDITLTSVRSYR
jgi:hypothetical protein